MDQLKCGDCGNCVFELYHRKQKGDSTRWGGHGSGGLSGALVVKCTNCGSVTTIEPSMPTLQSDGYLSGGLK